MIQNSIKLILVSILFYSCANESAPTGGKRDIEPPKLKNSIPKNKSLNFNSSDIVIQFNEYLNTSINYSEINISPPIQKTPTIYILGKKIHVKFNEPLLKDATYTINFGDAIKDVNEGNILKNFSYVFSTGQNLDSAILRGNISYAKNNEAAENIIVGLYNNDSLNIKNSKPYYFAKTRKNGEFILENIKKGEYSVFALNDKNINYQYDLPEEEIGFLNEKVLITDTLVLNLKFNIFKSNNANPKLIDVIHKKNGEVLFCYNGQINNFSLNKNIENKKELAYLNSSKDTITYWLSDTLTKNIEFYTVANLTQKDTTRLEWKVNESEKNIYNNIDILNKVNQIVTDKKRDKPTESILILNPLESNILVFSRPIDTINNSISPQILIDSTNFKEKLDFSFDKLDKRKLEIKNKLENDKIYKIIFPKNSITDFLGFKNEELVYNFKTGKKSDYGNINLISKIKNQKSNYIVQLLNTKNEVIKEKYYSGTNQENFEFKNLPIGKYKIQVIEDVNKNGEWDSGNFETRTLPENIIHFKEEYEVKGNWDIEVKVDF